MKKSCLSTALSLFLFLSSANAGVLARMCGVTMSTTEIVPFCQEIKNLFEKNYEPVLSKVANPENAKPIPLKEPINKLVDNMSGMVKNAKTTECIAFSSYVLRLLERDKIVSGVVLLDKFGDQKNGHSVVVYKREVEIQGKKMEKWVVCDLSSAFLFWTRSKIMSSFEAKNRTLDGIDLKDPKNALKSMEDFLSIPLMYYFDGMGASKIYDAPKVLNCDLKEFSINSLSFFIGANTNPKSDYGIKISDYDRKISDFFRKLEFKHEERVVNEELRKKGISLKDAFETFLNGFGVNK